MSSRLTDLAEAALCGYARLIVCIGTIAIAAPAHQRPM